MPPPKISIASRNFPRYAARRPAQTMLSALGSPRALSQAAAKSASSFARDAAGTGGRISGLPRRDVASGVSAVWSVCTARKREKGIAPFLPVPLFGSGLPVRAGQVGHRLRQHRDLLLIARARRVGV